MFTQTGKSTTDETIQNIRATKHNKKKTTKNIFRQNFQESSKQRMLQVIKRFVICTISCIISDVIAIIVVGVVIRRTLPRFLTESIFDVSLFLNILFFLLSFKNYKKIFVFVC